jgi:recombination protein RecR
VTSPEIERLVQYLARLPGLGPRSARRAALHLMKKREALFEPLAQAMAEAAAAVRTCSVCGNLDTRDPCGVCADARRDRSAICVVEEVGDLWALERTGAFRGLYHVLGGTLSALDGVGPDDLAIAALVRRVSEGGVAEVILALNATVEGPAAAHDVGGRQPTRGRPVGPGRGSPSPASPTACPWGANSTIWTTGR